MNTRRERAQDLLDLILESARVAIAACNRSYQASERKALDTRVPAAVVAGKPQ